MPTYAIEDADGVIRRLETSAGTPDVEPGHQARECPEGFVLPPQPSPAHWLGWSDGPAWMDSRTISQLRDDKWAEIKAIRDELEFANITWDGSVFNGDALSRQRIKDALQHAELKDEAFSTTWVLADNSTRAMSAADLRAIVVQAGDEVVAAFQQAFILRMQIEAAPDITALNAIQWPGA